MIQKDMQKALNFKNFKESLHSWDKAHLVMVYDFFNMLLDSVC